MFKIESNIEQILDAATSGNINTAIGNQVSFGRLNETSSKQFSEAFKANSEAASYQASVYLEATQFTSSTADGSNGPRYSSNQILLEPLKAISPDSLINSTIASNSTLAKAFVGQTKETLDKTAPLSQTPGQINSPELQSCLDQVGTKCSTVAEAEANQAEVAHGNNLQATFGNQTIAANGLRLHSDTTIAARTPHLGFNTQDYHVQANNSAVVISTLHLQQSQQKVSIVEGTSLHQTKTSLTVASDNLDSVSRNLRNTGVETVTTAGKNNTSLADEQMTSISGGDIGTTAYGSIANRAAGNISIIASPNSPAPKADINATGESLSIAPPDSQILIMTSDGKENTSSFGMSNSGALTSSTQSVGLVAGLAAGISGLKSVSSVGGVASYFGTEINGILTVGNKTWVNTLPGIVTASPPAPLTLLPLLPSFSTLASQDLASCLPKSIEQKNVEKLKKAKRKTVSNPSQVQDGPPDSVILIPEGTPSPTQPKEVARNLNPGSITAVPGMSPNKLPGVALTDKTDKTQAAALDAVPGNAALDTGALSGASVNIYLEKLDETPGLNLSGILEQLTGSIDSILNSPDPLTLLGIDISSQTAGLTPEIVSTSLKGIIPNAAIAEFNDPALFSVLTQIDKNKLASLSAEDFPTGTSAEIISKALKLLKAYPNAINSIKEIINRLTIIPAIGFLGGLTSILTSFNIPGVSQIANTVSAISTIPQIISSGKISQISGVASNLARLAGLDLSPVTTILADGSIQNLGRSVLSGDIGGVKSSIESLLSSRIKAALPNELGSAVESVKSILMAIKSGDAIDSNSLIHQIAGVLEKETGSQKVAQATSIFQSLQPLIKDISSGNLSAAVLEGSLGSLLGQVVGAKNSGLISKAVSVLEGSIGTAASLSVLPEILNTLDEFKISSIDQIGKALSCLDLFNKVKSLISQFDSPSKAGEPQSKPQSALKTARTLERIPRMVQIANTIKKTSPALNEESIFEIGQIPKDIQGQILKMEIPYYLDPCFKIPRLSLAEVEVRILEINQGRIVFSFTNLDLLKEKIYLIPKEGDTIQINVDFFRDNLGLALTPYQTEYQYTPSIYSFIINELDLENNIGTAQINNNVSSLILEDPSGVLYEYSPYGIGFQLTPNILEAYVVA